MFMIFEHQGECPFCHAQIFLTMTNPTPTTTEVAEEAAAVCTCPEARLNRGMKATENSITKVLGEESMNAGFTYAATEETTDSVRAICQLMLMDFILGGVTFGIPGGDTLRLVKNGNAIKIRRSSKRQLEI